MSLKTTSYKNAVSIYHKLFRDDGGILMETFMKYRDVGNSRNNIPLKWHKLRAGKYVTREVYLCAYLSTLQK
jgi:hypothetical protein